MLLAQFALMMISFFTPPVTSHNIEVTITGIRNNSGSIIISVFKNQVSFEKEKPFLVKTFEKKGMRNESLTAKFNLETGTYGFALLDDENNDSKMEYNFLGIPREGFGFSNYYHTGFTKPNIESFQLEVKKETLSLSKIKIRYM